MLVRNTALVGWLGGALGVLSLLTLLNTADPAATTGARIGIAAAAVAVALLAIRMATLGLRITPAGVVVRSLFWSRRVALDDVAGLAIEPVVRRRWARLVVVTSRGDFVPCVFAAWRMGRPVLQYSTTNTAAVLGTLTDGRSATDTATAAERLEHPAAFTAVLPAGRYVAVPALRPDPGLAPQTSPRPDTSMLGRETVAMATAFVLPAAAAAVAIFARHVARVSNLDEFELPLPHNLPASLALMVLLYLSTAVFTPIALLLLARTGQWPRSLGLSARGLRLDALPGVGLLLGAWVTTFFVGLAFSPLLNNDSLTNAQRNTHVPAYFIVYAIVVSATTAINEEVVVNGYLMTRLAQLGWSPWRSLALSLALRTSYHAYYGVALIATVPFGYWATRSFQKHRRLGRPIVAHFLNDAVFLTIAVLTS